jgi:hypothetical protein
MAGNVKGAAMREVLRWHERNGGREQLKSIGRSLPHALRMHVDPNAEALGILPNHWYPAPLAHALLDGIFASMPRERRTERMREATHAAIKVMGRGMYRLVLEKLATPRVLAANIQRTWNLLFDDGERAFILTSHTSVESTTRNWTGHGAMICELMTENTAAVLETMGLANVEVDRVECVAHGAAKCVTRFRWAERA